MRMNPALRPKADPDFTQPSSVSPAPFRLIGLITTGTERKAANGQLWSMQPTPGDEK